MTNRKLKYMPSTHAIERFREYFAVKEIYAVDFANEIMQSAQFVMNQPDGRRIYQNDEHDTLVILAAKDDIIITVNPSAEKRKAIANPTISPQVAQSIKAQITQALPAGNAIIAAARATIQRELAKSRRSFTREYRRLTEEIAVIGLEIARHSLNKARARSPITQQQIAEKVAEIHAEQTRLAEQRKQLETEYRAAKAEAQQFIGMEVSV